MCNWTARAINLAGEVSEVVKSELSSVGGEDLAIKTGRRTPCVLLHRGLVGTTRGSMRGRRSPMQEPRKA